MSVDCPHDLIERKDLIHQLWFDLQSYPSNIKLMGETLLQQSGADGVVREAKAAISRSMECKVKQGMIQALEDYVSALEDNLKKGKPTTYSSVPYYSFPPSVATDILIEDINRVANAVHVAGSSLLDVVGEYGGCHLTLLPEDYGHAAVNAGSMAYCEGVTHRKGTMLAKGSRVEHHMGCHSNVVDIDEDDGGYSVKLSYTESGSFNWRNRRDSVTDRLEERFKLSCKCEYTSCRCSGVMTDADEIRKLAYFMSGLHDVDLLPADCVDDAAQHALDQADSIVGERGREAYMVNTYPFDHMEWYEEVCKVEEEDHEDRRDRARDRARERAEEIAEKSAVVKEWKDRLESTLDAPCTPSSYAALDSIHLEIPLLERTCQRLKEMDYSDLHDGCLEILVEIEEFNEKNTAQFLKQCPPIPIVNILETESASSAFSDKWMTMDSVQRVCEAGDDNECLEEIRRAKERWLAGVKPLTLPI